MRKKEGGCGGTLGSMMKINGGYVNGGAARGTWAVGAWSKMMSRGGIHASATLVLVMFPNFSSQSSKANSRSVEIAKIFSLFRVSHYPHQTLCLDFSQSLSLLKMLEREREEECDDDSMRLLVFPSF